MHTRACGDSQDGRGVLNLSSTTPLVHSFPWFVSDPANYLTIEIQSTNSYGVQKTVAGPVSRKQNQQGIPSVPVLLSFPGLVPGHSVHILVLHADLQGNSDKLVRLVDSLLRHW